MTTPSTTTTTTTTTTTGDLAAKLAERERARDVHRAQLGELEARLVEAKDRRSKLEDLWGADAATGAAFDGKPLAYAIGGVIGANFAMFAGFIVWLERWRLIFWSGLYVVAIAGSLATLTASSKQLGAGGRARINLRRVTMAFVAIAILEGVIAALVPKPHF